MSSPTGRPKFKRNWAGKDYKIPRYKGDKKVLDGLQELVDGLKRKKKPAAVEATGETTVKP